MGCHLADKRCRFFFSCASWGRACRPRPRSKRHALASARAQPTGTFLPHPHYTLSCSSLFFFFLMEFITCVYSRTSLGLQQTRALTHRASRPPRAKLRLVPQRQQQQRERPTRPTHRTGKTCRHRSHLRSRPCRSPNHRAHTRLSIPTRLAARPPYAPRWQRR
jgi:hypothetical protein